MGCTPSQTTKCIVVEQTQRASSETKPGTFLLNDSPLNDLGVEKSFLEQEDTEYEGDSFLQDSLKSSQSSNLSWDSGVYELEDSSIITEYSDPEKVREVDNQFKHQDDLELIVEGKACPRKLSSKDRDTLQQTAILEMLREEGLICRPPSKAGGGIRFELVSTNSLPPTLRRLPPLKLQKKYKEKKEELTYEEIQQKLLNAEDRRKRKNEEKLSKLSKKDRQEIQAKAEQEAERNRQKLYEKLQTKTQSREKHLNELQERLKAREEHARNVRKRKQMLANRFNYIMPV
ncbi:stress response protein NST1-like [Stegodyphus dumicola]|uniref:stress response protein NST1-like n=1 Tax=Stegodyphus dumicola TaxID=202533 RepID=UPI0015B06EB3|nr:stress response protein NST1-like [Stegodyphus dumicola]